MSAISTKAIWLGTDGQLTVRHINVNDRYEPKGSQTLIRVAYSAINPADLRHFFLGLSDYVAGYEWVGSAIKTGPSSPFKVDQQLFGITLAGDHRPISRGAHQDYLLADAEWTYALPSSLNPKDAVAFPVGIMTSIDALFNQLGFGLPAAGVSGASGENEAILIWGGGSIVGQAGVQLAKAAGFLPIITTASPRNHEFLEQIGATHCFDYRSPDIVKKVRSALNGKKLRIAYDSVAAGLGVFEGLTEEQEEAVGAQCHLSSPALAKRCCDESEELKLTAVLPVSSDWSFPMRYRVPRRVNVPKPKGVESLFEGVDSKWGNRMQQITSWLLEDGAHRWTPPKSRVVRGAEAGIVAIRDIFDGKAGGEKVLIEHPM